MRGSAENTCGRASLITFFAEDGESTRTGAVEIVPCADPVPTDVDVWRACGQGQALSLRIFYQRRSLLGRCPKPLSRRGPLGGLERPGPPIGRRAPPPKPPRSLP